MPFQPGPLVGNSQHVDVIPVVTFESGGQPVSAPPIQVSAEIFEAVAGPGLGAEPVPMPWLVWSTSAAPASALAPQAIFAGQTMRLIAQAAGGNACIATLSFKNAAGVAVGPTAVVNVPPGRAQALDLDAGVLYLTGTQDALILPAVQIGPTAAASPCQVTSEIFFTNTGLPGGSQTALYQ